MYWQVTIKYKKGSFLFMANKEKQREKWNKALIKLKLMNETDLDPDVLCMMMKARKKKIKI